MIMICFFDYIFYRTYIAFKKRGEEQVIGPTIHVGNCFGGLFSPIWWGGYYVIVGRNPPKMYVFVMASLIYLLLFIRYKKKYNQIIQKYSRSKYNKTIPVFLIYCMVAVCVLLGIILTVFLERFFLEPFHLEGILGRWLNL